MALRDYIVHNAWWKLLSLLLAALTWLTIETAFKKDETLRETPVITSSIRSFPAVPIEMMTSATNGNRFQVTPNTVTVEVSGTKAALERLQAREIKAFVDLGDMEDDRRFRAIVQTEVPENLKVMSVSPAHANVERIMAAK